MNMNKQTLTIRLDHSGDFATFGVSVMAYVKKTEVDGKPAYVVCSANGTALGTETSEAGAMLCARMNNLFPVAVQ